MKERIGEIFEGTISAVTAFGIFVALDSVYVEGLVHVSELGSDYFQFDNIKHQMVGERTGQRFRLGDRVRVKLVRADLESNRIDFVLAPKEGSFNTRTPSQRHSSKPVNTGSQSAARVAARKKAGAAAASEAAMPPRAARPSASPTARPGKPASAKPAAKAAGKPAKAKKAAVKAKPASKAKAAPKKAKVANKNAGKPKAKKAAKAG
ncbi:MAG: S1 RNA-binding domain-containing protein [Rhodocyclales bacterium]|nr:S1 RNA-binding domain-containing protein [Rhodocyclales bacterium]